MVGRRWAAGASVALLVGSLGVLALPALRDGDGRACGRNGLRADTDRLTRFDAAASSPDEPLDILAVGDSLTEGAAASSPDERFAAVLVEYVREALGAPGRGRGFIPVRTGVHPGVWTVSGAAGPPDGVVGRGTRLAAGEAAEARVHGDEFLLLFDTGPEGVGLRVAVDDGPPTAVSAAAATDSIGVWSTGPLPSGDHLIHVEAADRPAVVHGVVALDGEGGTGVRLWDAGVSGATTVSMAQAALGLERLADTVAPDLVVLSLGANDRTFEVPVATFETSLRVVVAAAAQPASDPPSVLLWVQPRQAGTPAASWAPYVAAIGRVAADTGAVLVDVGQVIGAAVPGPLFADVIHPSDEGHAAIGAVLAAALGVFPCDVVQGWVTDPAAGSCVAARDTYGRQVGTSPVDAGGRFEVHLDAFRPELRLWLGPCSGPEGPTVAGPTVAPGTPFIAVTAGS